MASGVTVEPQALLSTGEKLQALGEQAGGTVSKAAGAVVHPKSWGLVGMATLYSGYAAALPQLHEHLHAVQTTLGAAGAKLIDAAQAYEEADKAAGANLDRMGGPREPRAGHLNPSNSIDPSYDVRDHGYVPRSTADRWAGGER